ncbi:spore maturation protein A [Amphibacillus marinus]|uniref:Spore maturation protein A n=1 Tax=Amphibacillus marinus TaxID=872970 RepID=A0A1H8GBD0_9BACI|nr:nucleoside recognition domain-containing protein [Amphibacillus marinus]SEN41451.1 spore maturation protein A [Amphibacillus marinus]
MVHLIWASLACIGIIYALFNGTITDVNEAIFTSGNEAVQIVIGLTSILIFWLGLMRVAEEAKVLKALNKLFRPLFTRLFPELPSEHRAIGYITSNFIANLFGLGNAATPLGIKAMKEMQRLSDGNQATRSMVTFLVINTTSLTFIPTTVIALRIQYGSAAPTEIVFPTFIASCISIISALIIDRLYYFKREKRKK